MADELWCWRHPRAQGAEGRCIGRTDLPVHRRRAKRAAHRVRAALRHAGLARQVRAVWTSPRARCLSVARWLARWGFAVHVDARLAEMDFGRWDGRPWSEIAFEEVEAWRLGWRDHAPGGGESLAQVAARAAAFAAEGTGLRLVLTHGGWINALLHGAPADARAWPPALAPGQRVVWRRADAHSG